MKNKQAGFHLLVLALVVIVLSVVAAVGLYVFKRLSNSNSALVSTELSSEDKAAYIKWNFDGETWQPSSDPPACPDPLTIQTPTDLSKVTGILYPGQYRGDDFKTHGGFVFNPGDNNVTVKAPMDAYLVSASRYTSGQYGGDPQYFLIFIAPCGIMHYFDHITVLGEKFQELTEVLPEPLADDSRTVDISPPIAVKTGDVVGTKVGLPINTFFDFGVNDLRQQINLASDPDWANEHYPERHYDYYGVCWFDLLPEEDAKVVRNLPAGGKEGKVSDYCT